MSMSQHLSSPFRAGCLVGRLTRKEEATDKGADDKCVQGTFEREDEAHDQLDFASLFRPIVEIASSACALEYELAHPIWSRRPTRGERGGERERERERQREREREREREKPGVE
jgi:hypothetical protein